MIPFLIDLTLLLLTVWQNKSGRTGNDQLFGNLGADILSGCEGNDELFCGQDNDSLLGGKGRDILSGDLGNDTLTGGSGVDTFVIGLGRDLVLDFENGTDKLQLISDFTFEQLAIAQDGNLTVIQIAETNELIARLDNINADNINADDFVTLF